MNVVKNLFLWLCGVSTDITCVIFFDVIGIDEQDESQSSYSWGSVN